MSWLPATFTSGARRRAQDRLALAVAREVRLARLVLDVVAQVDDEVGSDLVVHPPHEVARELGRQVRQLAQLAAEARLAGRSAGR